MHWKISGVPGTVQEKNQMFLHASAIRKCLVNSKSPGLLSKVKV